MDRTEEFRQFAALHGRNTDAPKLSAERTPDAFIKEAQRLVRLSHIRVDR
jgi:hypothetical protein